MIKKPFFYHSLYIDPKGLHWLMLEKTKTGVRTVYKTSHTFAQIFGDATFAGQTLSVDPIAAAQGGGPIVNWLQAAQTKKVVEDFLKKSPIKSKNLSVCFSEAFSVFRFFSMPKVEKMYWKKAIPIEARKYVPYPLEQCYCDWRAVELSVEGKPVLGVLFGAMRKEIFGALQNLVQGLGFDVALIDSLPFAMSRSVEHLGAVCKPPIEIAKQSLLTVYLDLEQVQLMLLHRGVPVLSRSIYLADASTRGSFLLERRKLDLQATIDFANRQLGIKQLDKILLIGSAGLDESSLKNWASGLSEELGIKVELIKPLQTAVSMGNEKEPKPLVLDNWSDLAGFGLALRGISTTLEAQELNLAAAALEVPPKKIALKKIWTAGALVSAAMLVFGILKFNEANKMEARAEQARSQIENSFPEVKGKDAATLKALIETKQSGARALAIMAHGDNRIYLTPMLMSLVDNIPLEAWVEAADYSADRGQESALSGVLPTGSWKLRGRVEVLGNQQEFTVAQNFFKSLKESPAMNKRFPQGNISIKKEASAASSEAAPGNTLAKGSLNFNMEFKSNGPIQP